MVCPKCISHNPEQAEACHWCGNALRQEQEAASAETVVTCVACGGQINPTANFCSQCGAARIPLNEPVETEPQFACVHCGGSLNLGDNYCKWCGLPMADSTGSTSTPAHSKSQQKEAARVAFRESIEKSFALKEAARVDFRESIEKSFALKEEQRAQKELEREVAANIAAVQKAERRAQKEAERAEREAAQKEAARRERELAPIKPAKPAKEEDDFDVAAIAKTIVRMAPIVSGGKALSPEVALLVGQVLEEFQKKSDDTSASAALSYFNQAAFFWKMVDGNLTDRDMAIFAVYQFLNLYKAWRS